MLSEIAVAEGTVNWTVIYFATFGVSLGVCENKKSFHRPLASCSQGVQVTKTKRIATTSKSHVKICDFSEKTTPQAKIKKYCDRPLGVCSAQRMRNSVVDRADDEKYCFGSRRKWLILLWIAQKMKHIVADRAENSKYCCGAHIE